MTWDSDRVEQVLRSFGVRPPFLFDPSWISGWDSKGDDRSVISAIPAKMVLPTAASVERVRMLPLALVPVRQSDNIYTVMKVHDSWDYVLPSSEVGLSSQASDCISELTAMLQWRVRLEVHDEPTYAGIAVSFKTSASHTVRTCYIFPLFVFPHVRRIKHAGWVGRDHKTYRPVWKMDLDILAKRQSPNADVYDFVGRLFPGWSGLSAFC